MSNDDNSSSNHHLDWSCCNDGQSLFLLLYVAFLSLTFVLLQSVVVAKPLRLVCTFIHELSHAVACWLTGGEVAAIQVFHNEGGVTRYRGGWRCVIVPAGYVGCGFWAMVFVILSGGRRTATVAAAVFTAALLAALCYSPNQTMVLLNLGYAVLMIFFIVIEWFVYSPILQFVILFLGVFVGINAIADIHSDTILRNVEGSDSHACSAEVCPCCHPRCVGLQWITLAIFFQLFGIWIALVQMSTECAELGWFQCLNVSVELFDWNRDGFEFFDFLRDLDFWDNH
jgi:Peptidase M50B-like